MPADDANLIADYQSGLMDYEMQFGNTFDRWQVGNDPELMRAAIAGMKQSLESGKPLTDKDLGITEPDPSLDL